MIHSEPIDGLCPRCHVDLNLVPAEYEQGYLLNPEHVICPECDWEPGDQTVHACDNCGTITNDLVEHDNDEYCTKCHKEQTFVKLSKLILEASMRVNFETQFGTDFTFTSIFPGIQVTVFDEKDVYKRHRIANSTITFDDPYKDPVEAMKSVYETLINIAIDKKLPNLKEGLLVPEVMSA